ncbi:hypothetical protein [Shimia ponticola]|uniref:hypothetical protein n=1 Tax=Shimia ponticola TaxID=2582893 RepID=UPI0011BD7E07|nr:hypothetical protein [Shimia ponticola]
MTPISNLTRRAAALATLALCAAGPVFAGGHANTHETLFPQDFKNTCGVDAATLQDWFGGVAPSQNGFVVPANSVTFDDSTNCNFYKWGAQMFLWLTSPTNQGPVIFNSPVFFDATYTGELDDEGFATFNLTRNANPDDLPTSLRSVKSEDPAIDEIGQADSYVLVTPKNDTAYFGVHVNDVYAAFAQMHLDAKSQPGYFDEAPLLATNFPTTQSELDFITTQSLPAGESFPDGDALTMELKTAWVAASDVEHPENYITITGMVPEIEKNADNTQWSLTGTPEPKELALVGMHVVGSAKGHPEMIWASFEHVSNAPDLPYYYQSTSAPAPTLFTPGTDGDWTLFTGDTVPATVVPTAQYKAADGSSTGGAINALGNDTIEFVPVARLNPWGFKPQSTSAADDATDLLSLNNTVMTALAAQDDVRAYYYQIGSIWTGGNIPTSATDNIKGGDRLANTTMETFHQFPDGNTIPGAGKNAFQAQNCFFCHSSSADNGLGTSHVFGDVANVSD